MVPIVTPFDLSGNIDFDSSREQYQADNINESRRLFDQLLPLIQFLFSEPNPAPVKWLLAQRGHIRSDRLRLPMTAISSAASKKGTRLIQGRT
nr:dihydrodipicolinate synthase family protein [Paenibacillus thiaminolyticus]